MRRAVLTHTLAATLLAAPALASAQAAGAVTFANGRTFPMFVNATECRGGVEVVARWNPVFLNGATSLPAGGSYTIYASNLDPTTNTAGATTCFTTNGTATSNPTLLAGTVPDLDGNNGGVDGTIDLGAFIAAAGKSCSNENEAVWICVQGKDSFGTLVAFASTQVTISTTFPAVPRITAILPGNRALNVHWDPGTLVGTLAETLNVQFEVRPLDPTFGGTVATGRFSASPARIENLNNFVVYDVRARAFTKADNASELTPELATTGEPQLVNDFWTTYKNAGGRDPGGCSSALAGPFGLAVLALTLGLVRRRRA